MVQFVSEPIQPRRQTFDLGSMGRGEPGLPRGFTWRGHSYEIAEKIKAWKHSEPEGGRSAGQRYLRRHYYRLRMSDGSIWTVYFTRQPPGSGPAKSRWFLYTVDRPSPGE
jgi:hypothetical protein